MPYKNVEDRRKAYKRWVKRNPEKKRAYNTILRIAKKHNKIPQVCKIEGCSNIGERHHPDYSKPREIEWICRSHHRSTQHHGKCSICGDKTLSRGYCNKHYKSERLKIDPEYAKNVKIYRERARK